MHTAQAITAEAVPRPATRRAALVARLAPLWAAGGLALLALGLRLYHIGNRPLWLDETYTAHAVRFHTLAGVLSWTYASLDQMPVFNVLTWLLRGLGATEWALRLPSAIAGALAVLAVYWLGATLARPRVGLVAALFIAIAPLSVWYGQEARAYEFFMLVTTLQMLFAYRAVTYGYLRDWALFTVLSALNLYTHYIGLATAATAYIFIAVVLLVALVRAATSTARVSEKSGRTPWDRTHARRLPAGMGRPASSVSESRRSQGAHLAGQVTDPASTVAPPGASATQPAQSTAEGRRRSLWRPVRDIGLAVLSAAIVVAAYVPWMAALQAFLRRGDTGFAQFSSTYVPTLATVQGFLAAFGFKDLSLALLGLGLVATLVWLCRGYWKEGMLLLLWLAAPLTEYWLQLHGGLVTVAPRFLLFLLPGAALLLALGVEGIAAAIGYGAGRLRERWRGIAVRVTAARVVSGVLALLLALQLSPALAAQYAAPKTDYRDATNYIIDHSPPNSVVFAVGTCNYFILGPLEYYLWRRHSPIMIVDGAQLDDRVAARLAQGTGNVWVAVITGSASSGCSVPADLSRVSTAGLQVTPFTEISLVRVDTEAPAHVPAMAQAKTLLRWGSQLQPQLQSSLDLLDVLSRGARLGANLLPAPAQAGPAQVDERWRLMPGTALSSDHQSFELTPTGGAMVNVTLTTRRVTSGKSYVIHFAYRNAALQGEQKVYVSAVAASGQWLSIFPNGAGYTCAPATNWTGGTFALTVPAGTTSLIVWLRATGSGAAEFQAVTLRPVE